MKSYWMLLKNETKLNIRDMNMVLFAVFMPLVILVILGIVYGAKPAYEGAAYTFLEQSVGAVCAISICAGGLMGLPMLVSEYREKKILKRFRVTPVSPGKLLLVELSVYVLYCVVSLISSIAAARVFWGVRFPENLWAFLGSWLLTMCSTFALGMLVGGRSRNSKQAAVIATVLYFPMLIFSGTTLPMEIMPEILQKIMRVFPLTQGITLMKNSYVGIAEGGGKAAVIVMIGMTIVCAAAAVRFFRWE